MRIRSNTVNPHTEPLSAKEQGQVKLSSPAKKSAAVLQTDVPAAVKNLTNATEAGLKVELQRTSNYRTGERIITPLTMPEVQEAVRSMVKSARVYATFNQAHSVEVGAAKVEVEAGTTVSVDAQLDSSKVKVTFGKPLEITDYNAGGFNEWAFDNFAGKVSIHSIEYNAETRQVEVNLEPKWAKGAVSDTLEQLFPQDGSLNLESIESLLDSLHLGGEVGRSKLSNPSFEVTLRSPPQDVKITTDQAVLKIPKNSLSYISGSYSGTIADPVLEQLQWEFRGNSKPILQAKDGPQALIAFDMDRIVINGEGNADFHYSSLTSDKRQDLDIVNSRLEDRYQSLRALIRSSLAGTQGDLLPLLGMAE